MEAKHSDTNMSSEQPSGVQVAEMVDRALRRLGEWQGEAEVFSPLNVRNVIVNAGIGPELPYGRVLHALGRSRLARRFKGRHPAQSALPRRDRQPLYLLTDEARS